MAVTAEELANHLSDLLANNQEDGEGHSFSVLEMRSDSVVVECTDDADGMVNFYEVKPIVTEL